jgi:hypothetical protein
VLGELAELSVINVTYLVAEDLAIAQEDIITKLVYYIAAVFCNCAIPTHLLKLSTSPRN